MKAAKHSPSEQSAGLQDIVSAACAFEARQRHVAMEQNDLRVQETAAELIFIAGEDLGVSTGGN